MQLSQLQLNSLMAILPKMRISHVLSMSTWSRIPFETLLNIRTAGKVRKIASFETVSALSDQYFKPIAQKAINQSKNQIMNILKDVENNDEIMNKLKFGFLEEKKSDDFRKSVRDFLKEAGITNQKDLQDLLNFASLYRITEGAYDTEFAGVLTKLASKLKSFASKDLDLSLEEALNDVMAMVATGSYPVQHMDISEEQKKKIQEKGMGLEEYISTQLSSQNIPGAGSFFSGIQQVAGSVIKNLTTTGWLGQKKKYEKTKEDLGGGGEYDDRGGLGEELEAEYEEDRSEAYLSDNDDLEDSRATQNDDGDGDGDDDVEKISDKLKTIDEKIKSKILKNIEDIVRANIARGSSESKIEKTIFIYKNALENPEYAKTDIDKIKDKGITDEAEIRQYAKSLSPHPATSTFYFMRNKDKMKKRGIKSEEEYRKLVSGNVPERIQNDIYELIDREKEKILKEKSNKPAKAASVSLSHQLLKRAASQGSLNMLGLICSANANTQKAGSVMVFERGRPKFAHTFAWNIKDSKIRIANVEDVDSEHINEAYQAAFQAIKEEVRINNLEESL